MHELFTKFFQQLGLYAAAGTLRQYRWNMQVFDCFLNNNKLEVQDVTRGDIERFLLQTSSHQLRKRRLCIIRRFYEYLFRTKRNTCSETDANPTSGITFLYRAGKRVPYVPGIEQVDTLVKSIRNKHHITTVRNQLLLELAYGSGLRRCELMALDVEDIDFTGKTVRVRGKGSRERIVPLTERSRELVERYVLLRGKGVSSGALLVSFNTGKRLTAMGIYRTFKVSIGIRPHLLRHACATHMLDNGCDIRYIQELLGHKSLSVTQRYTQVSKKKLAEVINSKHPSNPAHEKKRITGGC